MSHLHSQLYCTCRMQVAPEPVDRWQNVGNHNLLDKFYHDKERYAYTFQNYIFFTRMMQVPLLPVCGGSSNTLCHCLLTDLPWDVELTPLLQIELPPVLTASAF